MIVGDRLESGDGDKTKNIVVSRNLSKILYNSDPHAIYVASNHPDSVAVAEVLEDQGILIDTGKVVNYGYANSVTAKKYLLNISYSDSKFIESTLHWR